MARIFRPPTFNMLALVWLEGQDAAVDEPDYVDILMQVYVHSRADIDVTPGQPERWVPPIYLRFPKEYSLIRTGAIIQVSDRFGDYYKVRWAQAIHMGFPNEYWMTQCEQCDVDCNTPRP